MAYSVGSSNKTETIISPYTGWQFINFKELLKHKELFFFFILKDIKIRYKQTVLGNLWSIIQPLVTMLILSLFFGILSRMPTDGLPYSIFVLSALVPWYYFSKALSNAGSSLVSSSYLVSKMYFPREIIPLTPIFACLWDFFFSFLILIVLMLAFGIIPNVLIILTPVLVLLMMLIAAGAGLFLSALSAKYRDVEYTLGFLLQILMFSSPIIYPLSLIPENYRLLYALNPLVGVIEGFRSSLLGHDPFPVLYVLISLIEGSVFFVIGAFYFKRTEHYFADVL